MATKLAPTVKDERTVDRLIKQGKPYSEIKSKLTTIHGRAYLLKKWIGTYV